MKRPDTGYWRRRLADRPKTKRRSTSETEDRAAMKVAARAFAEENEREVERENVTLRDYAEPSFGGTSAHMSSGFRRRERASRGTTSKTPAGCISKADGEYPPNLRNLRPYSFRHSLNTLLRDAGEDPAILRAAFGWANEAIQDNYTHRQPEHFESQRANVERLFG